MPPSGHSSSSHHSSSHSSHSSSSHSSHSSSSHSSSSRSSSYSSGSHYSSHTSHSSATSGSRYSGSSTPRRQSVTRVPRPERARTNQPLNYNGRAATHKYKCIKHDYVYYGEDWKDSNGASYLKGYYDEVGNRYDALVIDMPDGSFEATFECPYCGTVSKETWSEGAVPQCKNCGANLVETDTKLIHDKIDDSTVEKAVYETTGSGSDVGESVSRGIKIVGMIIGGMLAWLIAISGIVTSCSEREENNIESENNYDSNIDYNSSSYSSSSYNSNVELFGETIHVDSINRDIKWHDEYDSYYDPVSDCYAYYNLDLEPALWQYWYEGISSDYGDYGWMEYDMNEGKWYIEKSQGEWVALPSKYDTSKLWYMTGTVAGTSYIQDMNLEVFGDSVTVDDDEILSYWDENMNSYYVAKEDCYVRVNFDVDPQVFQYWFNSVSEKYSVNGYGGWLEYDYDNNIWWISDENDEWSELAQDEAENLWHVEDKIVNEDGTVFSVNGGLHL